MTNTLASEWIGQLWQLDILQLLFNVGQFNAFQRAGHHGGRFGETNLDVWMGVDGRRMKKDACNRA